MSEHQHHDHGHDGDPPEVDHAFSAAAWDERYRSVSAVWSGRPNQVLVAEAADLPPGTVWTPERTYDLVDEDRRIPIVSSTIRTSGKPTPADSRLTLGAVTTTEMRYDTTQCFRDDG